MKTSCFAMFAVVLLALACFSIPANCDTGSSQASDDSSLGGILGESKNPDQVAIYKVTATDDNRVRSEEKHYFYGSGKFVYESSLESHKKVGIWYAWPVSRNKIRFVVTIFRHDCDCGSDISSLCHDDDDCDHEKEIDTVLVGTIQSRLRNGEISARSKGEGSGFVSDRNPASHWKFKGKLIEN